MYGKLYFYRMIDVIYLLTGFVVGMGLSVQTSVNGRLRRAVRSPFLTSLISFFISLLFIGILVFIQVDTVMPSGAFILDQPFWIWLGGFFGCIFLIGNVLLFPKLGAVQTVIFPVLGQILFGLMIDQFGLFHAPNLPMTVSKLIGTLMVLSGVIGVILLSKKSSQTSAPMKLDRSIWFWRLLGIGTGGCSTLQITINGQLGVALHSAIHASLVSFIVGTISLLLMVCVQRPPLKVKQPSEGKNPWWMWMGGFLGALYVMGNAWISPRIGVGTSVVVGLLGLMSAGLIIDETGILESQRHPVSLRQVISLVVMFVGVCLIRLWH
jgi:transporter family-2 protein